MGEYALTRDAAGAAIICRMFGELDEQEVARMTAEVRPMIADARRDPAGFRLLWDIRRGEPTPAGMQVLAAELRSAIAPDDRTAALVRNSVIKMKLRDCTDNGHALFISEEAAMMWLNAWSSPPAAALRG